jgi:TolB protein
MQQLRSSLYFAISSLLLLPFAPAAHAQDWVRTGSNLGVEKIRMAAADF